MITHGEVSLEQPGSAPLPRPTAMPDAAALRRRFLAAVERFLPPAAAQDAETRRRAGLFIGFSALGTVFGGLFAAFYFAIGHPWGGGIVLACTLAMTAAPWVVRAGGLAAAGNAYALVLVLGFAGLTAIEGGVHGHAVAWLAVVPLCVTILVDQTLGRWWCAVCLALVAGFCALDFVDRTPAPFYPPDWDKAITAAGYVSLTLFMAAVGLLFERGRRHSFARLHHALDALSAANTRLKELDRERGEFLGIAAHDLRSPLNTIIGFAQLVQRYHPEASDMQRDALTRIVGAGGHMRDMLDRLLSLRAIEEGKLEFKLQPCDLNALAGQVVEIYQSRARDKSLRLSFKPAGDLPPVEADPQAVVQVLDNLLSNAIKFSPVNRPVTVRVLPPVAAAAADAEGARTAVVEVQDAGPGLSAEDQQKLYGKFARLSARPTGGETSNGLGLSIVKRLAEGMNGRLECQSELGKGATFRLTLRALDLPPNPTPPAVEPKAEPARLRV